MTCSSIFIVEIELLNCVYFHNRASPVAKISHERPCQLGCALRTLWHHFSMPPPHILDSCTSLGGINIRMVGFVIQVSIYTF